MRRHILSAVAAAVLALGAGAAAAQEIDFGSEQNRVWWNGVTPNELQELAIEAGATYTSVSDNGQIVVSQLEWPDVGVVSALQGSCNWVNGVVVRDDNCTELLLVVETSAPSDMELLRSNLTVWLTPTLGESGQLRLHRYEIHAYGTTRGRVLAELLLFRQHLTSALDLIDQINGY